MAKSGHAARRSILQVGDFQTAHWAIFVSTGRLEPQTAQWGVQVIQVGGSVVRIPNNVRNCGRGDVPNFLFQDTLYFGILLTSLGASWFKKQANRPLLIKNKTRSAAREERGTRKITPARFLVGVSGTAHHKPPTGLQVVLLPNSIEG